MGIFVGPITSLIEGDCVIQEKHKNNSLVVRYFRVSPVDRHVCSRQYTCFDLSSWCTLELRQTIWHAVCQRRSPSP